MLTVKNVLVPDVTLINSSEFNKILRFFREVLKSYEIHFANEKIEDLIVKDSEELRKFLINIILQTNDTVGFSRGHLQGCDILDKAMQSIPADLSTYTTSEYRNKDGIVLGWRRAHHASSRIQEDLATIANCVTDFLDEKIRNKPNWQYQKQSEKKNKINPDIGEAGEKCFSNIINDVKRGLGDNAAYKVLRLFPDEFESMVQGKQKHEITRLRNQHHKKYNVLCSLFNRHDLSIKTNKNAQQPTIKRPANRETAHHLLGILFSFLCKTEDEKDKLIKNFVDDLIDSEALVYQDSFLSYCQESVSDKKVKTHKPNGSTKSKEEINSDKYKLVASSLISKILYHAENDSKAGKVFYREIPSNLFHSLGVYFKSKILRTKREKYIYHGSVVDDIPTSIDVSSGHTQSSNTARDIGLGRGSDS